MKQYKIQLAVYVKDKNGKEKKIGVASIVEEQESSIIPVQEMMHLHSKMMMDAIIRKLESLQLLENLKDLGVIRGYEVNENASS